MRAAQEIAALIRARGLDRGARLPPEAELCAHCGVSRATLREALVALDVSGLVQLRRGASPVVRDAAARLVDGSLRDEAGPLEILRVRLLIEPEAARLAAARTAAEDTPAEALAAMEEAVDRMLGENDAGYATNHGDRDFHIAVARASGNSALTEVVAELWRMREMGRLWRTLEEIWDVAARRTRAVVEHTRVVEAIRVGDPARAEAAMRAHLQTSHEWAAKVRLEDR